MSTLTHIDKQNRPGMVDITAKKDSKRTATARAEIYLPADVWPQLEGNEFVSKKGPVIQTAIIAGTMAVKRTSDLIPFCHPLRIDSCTFDFQFAEPLLYLNCCVQSTGKTGVEMEALTGAMIAALTVYDMLKAASHHIEIQRVALLSKSGGKSDFKREKD